MVIFQSVYPAVIAKYLVEIANFPVRGRLQISINLDFELIFHI